MNEIFIRAVEQTTATEEIEATNENTNQDG